MKTYYPLAEERARAVLEGYFDLDDSSSGNQLLRGDLNLSYLDAAQLSDYFTEEFGLRCSFDRDLFPWQDCFRKDCSIRDAASAFAAMLPDLNPKHP